MTKSFIITGTDTDVGKTIVAATIIAGTQGTYWKPIQSGTDEGWDRKTIQSLTGLPHHHFLDETYTLSRPLSPHRAAELDDIEIDIPLLTADFEKHRAAHAANAPPFIIEGAGGLMVPITRGWLQIDLFAQWRVPVILCARTTLGTINHSLLSIEALRHRHIPIAGIVFVGADNTDNRKTICAMGGVNEIGWLPHLGALSSETLQTIFNTHFDRSVFI